MTLVELLVVIFIIVLLMGIAIPAMRPALKDRKFREATRQINAFFAGAKARAAEAGRPVGVWIARSTSENPITGSSYSTQLFLAEVTLPYSGDTQGATVRFDDTNNDGLADVALFDDGFSASLNALVEVNDLIKFGYKGPWYRITAVTTAGGPPAYPVVAFTHPSVPPPPLLPSPAPPLPQNRTAYQIYRKPIRSIVSPLTLPRNVVIDLSVSGIGAQGFDLAPSGPVDATPVVITFDPAGNVDTVYRQWLPFKPVGSIHLLVGRQDEVNPAQPLLYASADGQEEKANLMDTANFWVSIAPQTGLVSTTENASVLPTAPSLAFGIMSARKIARTRITTGGR